MYWTFELIGYLDGAPWPASRNQLIDFAVRTGAPQEVMDNLSELESERTYDGIDDVWDDRPLDSEYFLEED